jgi:hypothetical protein
MVTLTTGITFLVFTCMHIWVWGIFRRWFACVPTAYEVVHYCRKSEKQWLRASRYEEPQKMLGRQNTFMPVLTKNTKIKAMDI